MLKIIGKWLISLSFVAVGVTHFTDPEPFLAIMPQALPWHLELVYLSGFFEIVGGLGLLFPTTQKRAAWGLLALLVAVFPANINMLVNEVYIGDMPQEKWLLWLRIPFQLIFAWGVSWAGEIWPKPRSEVNE
jgi:uncharacterized membrane protein